jgi:hypothetical protein
VVIIKINKTQRIVLVSYVVVVVCLCLYVPWMGTILSEKIRVSAGYAPIWYKPDWMHSEDEATKRRAREKYDREYPPQANLGQTSQPIPQLSWDDVKKSDWFQKADYETKVRARDKYIRDILVPTLQERNKSKEEIVQSVERFKIYSGLGGVEEPSQPAKIKILVTVVDISRLAIELIAVTFIAGLFFVLFGSKTEDKK